MSIEFVRITQKKPARIDASRVPAKKCLSICSDNRQKGRSLYSSQQLTSSIPVEKVYSLPANVNLLQRKGPNLNNLPEELKKWLKRSVHVNISNLIEKYNGIVDSDYPAQETCLNELKDTLEKTETDEFGGHLLELVKTEIEFVNSQALIEEQSFCAQMLSMACEKKLDNKD